MIDPLQQTLDRYLRLCSQTLCRSSVQDKRHNIQEVIRLLHTHHTEVRSWADVRRFPHIESWLNYLHECPLKPRTRAARIGNLYRFFDDIINWQWPDAPLSDLIHPEDSPPQEHPLPKPLPKDVDLAVQEALRRESRLTAMGLLLLRLTGMRVGEMTHLNLNALDERDPKNFTLHVPMGKTRTERVIPVNEETINLVRAIQKQRGSRLGYRSMPTSSEDYLMVNPRGKRLARGTYWIALQRFTRHIPTTEHIHPHRFRHTFATEMIHAGMSVQVLMKILGHTNASMTMHYVEIAAADLRCDYDKAIQQLGILRNLNLPDPVNQCATPTSLRDILDIAIQRLESLHRDTDDIVTASQLRRFVKRLRRTRDDLGLLLKQTE